MPWPLSSSSISRYMLNHEDWNCYQPSKNIKIQCGIQGNVIKKECSGGCSGKAVKQ